MAMDEAGGRGGGVGGESVGVVVRLRPEEQSTDAGGADLAGSCVLCVEDHKMTVVDPGGGRTSSSGGGAAGSSGGGGGSSSGGGGSGGGGSVGSGGKGEARREQQQQGKQAHDFTFDRVFGPGASQEEVFESVKPLVHATVDGFTTTVFAYGSTGSGKTHTISGTEQDPGVLPRAVNLLFERLQRDAAAGSDKAFMVFLTYVEIYNNTFHNLLETVGSGPSIVGTTNKRSKSPRPDGTTTPPPPPPSKIEVREHPSRGVFLSGGRGLRVPVSSAAAVATLVSQGTKARRTASTSLNDRSSRSHAILILEIEATHSPTAAAVRSRSSSPCRSAGALGAPGSSGGGSLPKGYRRSRRASIVDCVSIGKMQVIDLAGSERVSMSGVEGSALVEAQSINLSLTLLGDVLSALSKYHRAAARSSAGGAAAGAAAAAAGEKPFVPYRNSKLTYLLKDSLGGNCKTLMICAVRAAPACFQQTMMSLRYAGRARDIKNVPHRVLEAADGVGGREGGPGGASLRGTVDEIERLRTQLLQTTTEFERLRGATASGESEKDELRQQLQALAEKNRCEKDRMDELLEGVIHSQKGELEMRKAEFVDLQDTMDSHADTIEKQKEKIRDLQSEREAASSEASTAREQVQGLRQALRRAETVSEQLHQEVSSLRAKTELLRIERDGAASKVSRMEEERRKTEAARKTEEDTMETYRKAVKKMAKEREGLKAAAREAGERADQAAEELAESKRGVEAAAAVAAMSEEALLLREANAEQRAKEAEGKARQLEKISRELSQRLNRKAEEEDKALKDKEEAERQREGALEEAKRCRGELARITRKSAAEATAAASSLSRASEDLSEEKDRSTRAQAATAALGAELAVAEAELSAMKESFGLLRKQKAEVDQGRELLETQKGDIENALAAEASKRSAAEDLAQRLENSTALAQRELEVLRVSLADALSGRSAATDRARRLSAEHRAVAEQLERATAATSSLDAAAILLREELAVERRKTGLVEGKLRESMTENEVLMRRCAVKDTNTEELRDSLAERDADVARLGADVQAAVRRGEEALRAMSDLHREEVEGARSSLDAKAAEAESVRQQLEEKDAKIASISERLSARAREAAVAAAVAKEETSARDREMSELRAALEARTSEVAAARELAAEKTEEARRLIEVSDMSRRQAEEESRKSVENHAEEMEHLRQQLEAQKAEALAAREMAGRRKEEAQRMSEVSDLSKRQAEEEARNGLKSHNAEMENLRQQLDAQRGETIAARAIAGGKAEEARRLREMSDLSRRQAEEEARKYLESHAAEIEHLRQQLEAQRAETTAVREKALCDAAEADRRLRESLADARAGGEAAAQAAQAARAAQEQLWQERQRVAEEAAAEKELELLRAKDDSLALMREAMELQSKKAEGEKRRLLASQKEEAENRLREALHVLGKEAEEARGQELNVHVTEIEHLREELEAQKVEMKAAREKAASDAEEADRKLREASAEAHLAEEADRKLREALAEAHLAGEAAAKVAKEQLQQQRQSLTEEGAAETDRALREKEERFALVRETMELEAKQTEEEHRRILASQQEAAEEELREKLELHEKKAREERERLEFKHREEKRLAEERITASFRERETKAEEERQRVARENRELLEGNAEEKERELVERLEARDGEVEKLKSQLRAVGRQVRHLETSKNEEEEARAREVQQSKAELLASEERAAAAEKRALAFAEARDEAATAAAAIAANVEAASRASEEEEGTVRAALEKELSSSRAEISVLRSGLEEASARLVETRGEAEAVRVELSTLRDQWRQKEEELGLRLRAVREEGVAAVTEHKAALAKAKDDLRFSLATEKREAATREAFLVKRSAEFEALVSSLRQDLEDAVEERDVAESSGQKRSDGMRERALGLGTELRQERASAATLRAAFEKAKLDAEDYQMEITSLRVGSAALEEDRNALQEEVPQLQARLEEKELECQQLLSGRKEAGIRAQEESARARGLEREVERLRSALRCTIATVQQHITSAAPNSPAALLAADIPFNSTARGDLSGNLSETASGGGGGGWPPRARGGSTTSGSTDGVGIPRFSSLVDATHDALYVEAGKSSSSAAVTLPLPGVAVDSNMATVGERGVSSEIPPAPPTENKDVRDDSCLLLPQPEGTWFGRKTGLTPSSPNRNRGDGGGGGNSGRVKGSGSSGGSSGGSRGGSRGGSGRIRESNSFDILSVDNSWPGGSAGDPDRREVAR